jgi:hypothetical protein
MSRKSESKVSHTRTPLKKDDHAFVTAPILSQIPYLNGIFDDEEKINQIQPIYVRETDSDYIRQCKLGGSRDLLVYIDPAKTKSKEPVPYPRPLWWDAMCEDFPLYDDQQEEERLPKSEHVSGASNKVVHGKYQQQNVPSRQNNISRLSRLSTNTKRK